MMRTKLIWSLWKLIALIARVTIATMTTKLMTMMMMMMNKKRRRRLRVLMTIVVKSVTRKQIQHSRSEARTRSAERQLAAVDVINRNKDNVSVRDRAAHNDQQVLELPSPRYRYGRLPTAVDRAQ